jgi:hypothetical protein
MVPVSTDEGVGAAMATIATSHGVSQGIQVCPGVYLATAHGVEEAHEGLDHVSHYIKIVHYPMSAENMIEVTNQTAEIIYSSNRQSGDASTDYVFIRVDQPIRPNDVVRPVQSSNRRLVQLANSGQLDVHLYRPQTLYNPGELSPEAGDSPSFDEANMANTFADILPLYQNPFRTVGSCRLGVYQSDNLLANDCPAESGVSGSPSVTSVNGENYLVGIQKGARNASLAEFNPEVLPNTTIQSAHFCEDFEEVCGQPCANMDNIIPPSSETVSL